MVVGVVGTSKAPVRCIEPILAQFNRAVGCCGHDIGGEAAARRAWSGGDAEQTALAIRGEVGDGRLQRLGPVGDVEAIDAAGLFDDIKLVVAVRHAKGLPG